MGRETEQMVTFRVPDGSNLATLIAGLTEAINAHASAIFKLAETRTNAELSPDLAFLPQRLEIIHGLLFELDRKVDTMSSNIDRIEKEAADAAENVQLVRAAFDSLNTTITDLKGVVEDLKAQLAQGGLDQARLAAAAAALEKADEEMDALTLPPPPATPEG